MPKRRNFNVPVDEKAATQFDNWVDSVPHNKGTCLTGALKAIQAIYTIDEALASKLMRPSLSTKQARDMLTHRLALPSEHTLPHQLLSEWQAFHAPVTDYAPSIAGALLLYMIVEPQIREEMRKLAYSKNLKNARIEARKILRKVMTDGYITGWIGDHSEEDRAILLAAAEQLTKTLSRHK